MLERVCEFESHRPHMTNEEVEPFKTAWRSAIVKKIVDGDTFDLLVDLGFDVHRVIRVRLADADTWEPRGENKDLGDAATRRVEELMPIGSEVRELSMKGGSRGSFRRWVAKVAYFQNDEWHLLSETLDSEGHTKH